MSERSLPAHGGALAYDSEYRPLQPANFGRPARPDPGISQVASPIPQTAPRASGHARSAVRAGVNFSARVQRGDAPPAVPGRLGSRSAGAGCDDRRPCKPSAFPAVDPAHALSLAEMLRPLGKGPGLLSSRAPGGPRLAGCHGRLRTGRASAQRGRAAPDRDGPSSRSRPGVGRVGRRRPCRRTRTCQRLLPRCEQDRRGALDRLDRRRGVGG